MKKVLLTAAAAVAVFGAAFAVSAEGRGGDRIKVEDGNGNTAFINNKEELDKFVTVNGEKIVTGETETGVVVDPSEQGKDVKWETIDKYEDARLKKESLEKTAAANSEKKAEKAAPGQKVLPKTSAVK